MQLGVFFLGNVDMPDASAGPPDPLDRRYYQADYVKQYDDLFAYAKAAEDLGFDSMWLAEHHFQHEGYEVIPNLILTSAVLAMKTERLKFAALVNIIPQWHPLRFAEDFAFADVVTRGRMICGVGRGTVPRESTALGARMGYNDSPNDQYNRELFEEQIEIIKKAWYNETFSHRGKHYTLPADGLDDRGREVTSLTLVPKPWKTPVEIWQPLTSPKTYHYAARQGHNALFWTMSRPRLRQAWDLYQELYEEHHGATLRKGEKRMLVTNVTIGETTEHAKQIARNGHDEYWKFLGPYGRQVNYLDENGQSFPRTRIPSLEESMEQGPWVVGTAAEVRKNLAQVQEELGVERLTIYQHYPGMVREQVIDQMQRFAYDVAPILRAQAVAIESAPPSRIDTSKAATAAIVMAQANTRDTLQVGVR